MAETPESEEEKVKKGICPQCDAKLVFAEGCKQCKACGWSACSVG